MTQLSANGKAAQAQIDQPYYGLVYLALASLCYRAEGAATGKVIDDEIKAYVAAQILPQLPAAPNAGEFTGRWQMEWGPVVSDSDANLMFALSYRDTSVAGDPPVFTAVCIRGTDTASTYRGDMVQFLEDLAANAKVDWTDSVNGKCKVAISLLDDKPRIAVGTCSGFQDLNRMTSGGQSVKDFLASFLSDHPGTPIVVTGHSLGACQTTVMAMYLQQTLSGAKVCPNPFAPPTAGNRKFAAMFNDAFASSTSATGNLWWNDMDLVPQAFTQGTDHDSVPSLRHIPDLWGPAGGPECPPELAKAVENWAVLYLYFEHPILHATGEGAKRNFHLKGSVGTTAEVKAFLDNLGSGLDPESWLAQLLYQHFPPVYYRLMTSQVQGLAPYPFLPVGPPLAA